MDSTVAELRWIADHGFVGVTPPGSVADPALPSLVDPSYEPYWTACAETGLALVVHAGLRPRPVRQGAGRDVGDDGRAGRCRGDPAHAVHRRRQHRSVPRGLARPSGDHGPPPGVLAAAAVRCLRPPPRTAPRAHRTACRLGARHARAVGPAARGRATTALRRRRASTGTATSMSPRPHRGPTRLPSATPSASIASCSAWTTHTRKERGRTRASGSSIPSKVWTRTKHA